MVAFVLLASASPVVGADPGTIVVMNTNDSGTGSLRQAILDATANEKVVVPAGTYPLTTAELLVDKSLTISGAGAGTTTIERSPLPQTPPLRIFHTTGPGNVITISGVTITGGLVTPVNAPLALGGGVENDGATLTLSKDIISGNTADARTSRTGKSDSRALGGGVYNTGTLNLVDADVEGNTATAEGDATGQFGGFALGGGVDSESAGGLSVRASTFAGNHADAGGNVTGEVAEGGGLLATQSGPVTVADSTFRDNVADASTTGTGTGAAGSANGGGAMLGSGAPMRETNVTFSGNVARATHGRISRGGGLVANSDQTLTNATLAGNSAVGAVTNKGGNIWVPTFDTGSPTAAIENSAIAGGVADAGFENCGADGIISSLGHNLENRNECNLHASGDLVNKDPLFGALSDNGGPVQTIPLKSGSPAIDAGAADVCPSTDARGVSRPAGRGCDIGAFEVAAPSATTGQAGSITTSSAVLSGTVSNPDFVAGTASFEYGPTTTYGSVTPGQPVSPTRANVPVSATVNGLAPGTTYHFRMVVRNAVGSAAGVDQTFTTATVFHPAQLAVRSVSVAGATGTVTITCDGTAGQRCAGTVRGTVRERVRGRSVVSVSADAAKGRAGKTKTVTVTVVSGVYSISTGRRATLRITANAVGRRLLASFYRLPARFVFSGPPQVSRRITFAYGRVTSLPVDRWAWKFPPCGACETLVTELMVPDLPSGAQVRVSCAGRSCPFARRVLRPGGRTLSITGLFAHSRLAPGTRIEVRVTAPNRVGLVRLFTTRAGTSPLGVTRCLPPGARAPVACRSGG